eukprot:IDg766t1
MVIVRRCPSPLSELELEGEKSLSKSLSLVCDDEESSLGSSRFLSALM